MNSVFILNMKIILCSILFAILFAIQPKLYSQEICEDSCYVKGIVVTKDTMTLNIPNVTLYSGYRGYFTYSYDLIKKDTIMIRNIHKLTVETGIYGIDGTITGGAIGFILGQIITLAINKIRDDYQSKSISPLSVISTIIGLGVGTYFGVTRSRYRVIFDDGQYTAQNNYIFPSNDVTAISNYKLIKLCIRL